VRTTRLRHARIELALHELRSGAGRALLLLHGLGERSPSAVPAHAAAWPGPVYALDFTGHGASACSVGGGYTAEVLMGDADTALRQLGCATLLGRGLGAYIALLLAGARPAQVRGAVLADGLGIAGGGAEAATPSLVYPNPAAVAPPDPFALVELSRDVRPPDYATAFARQANELSGLERPITVSCAERPDWLEAVL
jgi:pimeloyl-ACP methyl ester carboxylesterase